MTRRHSAFPTAVRLAATFSLLAIGCASDSGVAASGTETGQGSGADARRPDPTDAPLGDTTLADASPADVPTDSGSDSTGDAPEDTASQPIDQTESEPVVDSGGPDTLGEDPPEDGGSDLATEDLADTAADSTEGASVTEVELKLETDGGFTGLGATDYDLVDGNMAVHDPFHSPTDCASDLTEDQTSRLTAAAGLVDWSTIEPTYINPENPLCCCDQIVSGLTASLTFANADPLTVVTEWCDESLIDTRMPAKLLDFLGVLAEIGDEVLETCTLE